MTPEAIATITKSAFSIVEKLIVPKIQSVCKSINKEYNKVMIPRAEHFQEYFIRSYKKYNSANLLAMRNSQKELKDIYVPLSLKLNAINRERKNIGTYLINDYPKELLNQYKKIVITDSAGMGKSTISKIMFLSIIDKDLSRIPIFIELRRLNAKKTIVDEICEQLNAINDEIDRDLLLDFIASGGFIFFFDGFDEIALEDKLSVISDIQSFISKANDNYYVLTSRPEESLSCFGEFQSFSIEPLSKREAYNLLRKYDSQGEISKLLIEKIKLPENAAIEEFLTNPLLVSMLFSAFEYKQTIPLKKHLFYGQVFDALFNHHDLSKGGGYIHEKHSKLSVDDFERIIRCIGFECVKTRKTEFNKEEILQLIRKARDFQISLTFSESDYLQDLLSSVALFQQEGLYYRWCHKSLSEYFAARFIFLDAKENQEKILNAIYGSEHIGSYSNVIDIYYDIDPFSFRKILTKRFLNDYLSLCQNEDTARIELRQKLLLSEYYITITNQKIDHKSSISEQIKYIFNLDKLPEWWRYTERYGARSIVHVLEGNEKKNERKNEKFSLFLSLYARKRNPLAKRFEIITDDEYHLESNYVYHVSINTLNQYDKELHSALVTYCSDTSPLFIPLCDAIEELAQIDKELAQMEDESIIAGI